MKYTSIGKRGKVKEITSNSFIFGYCTFEKHIGSKIQNLVTYDLSGM